MSRASALNSGHRRGAMCACNLCRVMALLLRSPHACSRHYHRLSLRRPQDFQKRSVVSGGAINPIMQKRAISREQSFLTQKKLPLFSHQKFVLMQSFVQVGVNDDEEVHVETVPLGPPADHRKGPRTHFASRNPRIRRMPSRRFRNGSRIISGSQLY